MKIDRLTGEIDAGASGYADLVELNCQHEITRLESIDIHVDEEIPGTGGRTAPVGSETVTRLVCSGCGAWFDEIEGWRND